ncbi:unnamed protein product, partial [Pylaiella littoralis]
GHKPIICQAPLRFDGRCNVCKEIGHVGRFCRYHLQRSPQPRPHINVISTVQGFGNDNGGDENMAFFHQQSGGVVDGSGGGGGGGGVNHLPQQQQVFGGSGG